MPSVISAAVSDAAAARIRTYGSPPLTVLVFLFLVLSPPPVVAEPDDGFAEKRAEMIAVISALAKRIGKVSGKEGMDEGVMEVMARVPRHQFVPEERRDDAYDNRPLPIGFGQTISQPYIVALMTDLLVLAPGASVLEVGTGSGYQAAVLAELARRVFTIEIIDELGELAKKRLAGLGYANIRARVGDGYYGWPEGAPFDAIIVTAAASHIPPPLIQQLKPGGRMVIPVGEWFDVQYLTLIEKKADGEIVISQLLPVAFVPLTGEH